MNKDQLLERRSEAERQFDELTAKKAEIDNELNRLQGEYRVYNKLLEELEDPANTIVVKEKKGKK